MCYDFSKDYGRSNDGILRDNRNAAESRQDYEQYFVAGQRRADLTEERTKEYLDWFETSIDRNGGCYCVIYGPLAHLLN